jgi:hypothetical protein
MTMGLHTVRLAPAMGVVVAVHLGAVRVVVARRIAVRCGPGERAIGEIGTVEHGTRWQSGRRCIAAECRCGVEIVIINFLGAAAEQCHAGGCRPLNTERQSGREREPSPLGLSLQQTALHAGDAGGSVRASSLLDAMCELVPDPHQLVGAAAPGEGHLAADRCGLRATCKP